MRESDAQAASRFLKNLETLRPLSLLPDVPAGFQQTLNPPSLLETDDCARSSKAIIIENTPLM